MPAEAEKPLKPTRIPVAYLILGYEENRDALINFYKNAKRSISWVTDERSSEVASQIEWLGDEIQAARLRGVVCRTITDITERNVHYCRKVMNRINELRHISGVKAVFGVSEMESVAMVPLIDSQDIRRVQFIHSDSESVVAYKQLIFDALWGRAEDAESRIGGLELGKFVKEQHRVDPKFAIDRIYVCMECHEAFIFAEEARLHKKATGHLNSKELPFS